jgi:hypothetical protein
VSNPATDLPAPDRSGRIDPIRAAQLRRELEQAHDVLTDSLAALDDITSSQRPDLARYPHARWRLSSARRRRSMVATKIYAELAQALAPDELAVIGRMRADDSQRQRASALHVQQWTSERIAADWAGYCTASAPMRAALRDWIGAERAVLIPLLQRLSRRF